MTETDKKYISQGLNEIGTCMISLSNLYAAGLIEKEQLDYCVNIWKIINDNYEKLKNDEVPFNQLLSIITSTKGLIDSNKDNFTELVKSKVESWERYKMKLHKKQIEHQTRNS